MFLTNLNTTYFNANTIFLFILSKMHWHKYSFVLILIKEKYAGS